MSRRVLTWSTGMVLVVLTAVALGVVWGARADQGVGSVATDLSVQVVFALGAGLMWADRESRTTGLVLALAGISIGLGHLDSNAYWDRGGYWGELGWLVGYFFVPLVMTVLLRYPVPVANFRGRRLMLTTAWLCYVVRVPASLFWDPRATGYTGPGRWLTAYPANDVTTVMVDVASGVLLAVSVWFLVIQFRRWRRATGGTRSAVRLTAAAAIVLTGVLSLRLVVALLAGPGWVPGSLEEPLSIADGLAAVAASLVLLVVALRRAVRRSDVVERLLGAAGDPRAVEETLQRELADPSLSVSFRLGETWVDAGGQPVPVMGERPGRLVRDLARKDGDPTVRVDGDAAIDLDPGWLRITLAAAELVLDNTRLTVERTAHLAEIAAAQTRIVEAGVVQRRQLERDLHDGAQQSLLGVAATLSRAGLADDPDVMRSVLDEARGRLSAALAELRQLARGIHPAALSQGGLRAGLVSLAARTDRVQVTFGPGLADQVRLPPPVESTAYFVVAEAVANALKYGGPGPIAVTVERIDRSLVITVSDDGPGDARIVAGGGLAGLLDRVRALGGALDVRPCADGGVRVEARLPLVEEVG